MSANLQSLFHYLFVQTVHFFLDFEKEFYASDPNCSAAGKPLIEFDFYKGFLITHDDKRLR